jgi:ubiquitin C-terminal hydrolase
VLSAGELLAGDSAYHCDACACKVTATRRLRLHKLPPALLIHVNRAQWNLRAGGRKEKLQAHLPFSFTVSPGDLAGLGVLSEDATASYCSPTAEPASAGELAGEGATPAGGASAMDLHAETETGTGTDAASDVEEADTTAQPAEAAGVDADWHYRLQALVVHQGKGIDTGHYTAFGYENERDAWVLFDDHRVSVALPAEVARGQAYLLCYERTEGRAPSERGLRA